MLLWCLAIMRWEKNTTSRCLGSRKLQERRFAFRWVVRIASGSSESQCSLMVRTTKQHSKIMHSCRFDENLGLSFMAEGREFIVTEGFVLLAFLMQLIQHYKEALPTNEQCVRPKEKAGSFRSKAVMVKRKDSHRAVSQCNVTILTCLRVVLLMCSSICFYWRGKQSQRITEQTEHHIWPEL